MAAVVHTINSGLWGDGMLVDGISIPNAASFQQELIAKIGPGTRLPDPTHPVIVLRDGKPVLASATIGGGLHEATLQCLHNALDFGMNPKEALEAPQFGTAPLQPTLSYQQGTLAGQFPDELLTAVRALGQEIVVLPPEEAALVPGYWIAVSIDAATGVRRAATSPGNTGVALGH